MFAKVELSPDARVLFEQASDGLLLCDDAGMVVVANGAVHRLLHRSNESLLGAVLVSLFAPEWRVDLAELLVDPGAQGRDIILDLLTQGGRRLEIALRCTVWPPDDQLRLITLRPGPEVTLSSWIANSPDAVYLELLDGLPSAVLEFDPTGIILYANRQVEGILGYHPHEIIGHNAMEFVAEEARGRLRHVLLEQINRPRIVEHEYPVLAKDGSLHYVTTHTSPVFRGGQSVSLRTVLNDVTEQRRRESTLRVSEARLSHVFRHLPVMLCALDDEGLVSLWNVECERVTGHRADDIVGRPNYFQHLTDEPENLMLALSGPQAPGKELRDLEVEMRHKSGQRRIVSWSNVLRRVPIEGWSSWCVGVDVTAQRSTSQALHNYLAFLETLLSTIPSPVFYKDLEGRYLGCNDAFAKNVLGLPKSQIVGKRLNELESSIPQRLASI